MARLCKRRRVCAMPAVAEFGPRGTATAAAIALTVDEYEAIRLIDLLGFTQEDCALQMNVARTTVQAIYDTARKKLADALVNGNRLIIGGGSYDVCTHSAQCCGKSCAKKQCRNGSLCCEACTESHKI